DQWRQKETKVLLEADASETMLKSLKNPSVLVLATHGYFLPAQKITDKDRSGPDLADTTRSATTVDRMGQPIENPWLRCGLLLAGCNRSAESRPGQEDGIVTGLEIVGLNLQGCELVVLSACETGVGDFRAGEGVAGLRQAFHLAGARSVLA